MYPFSAGVIAQSRELWDELRPALEANSIRVVFELPDIPENWASFQERIERVRPDIILLEVTRLREPVEDIIARIRATAAKPAVFALHTVADPQAILAAMRAGAMEFLCPPLQQPLGAAFQRLDQERKNAGGSTKSLGKTLGFLSVKGGCGATTIACHVAAALGPSIGDKVLLADLDMQAGLLGFLTKAKNSYTIADAAGNLQRLDPSYWRALVSNGIPNVEVIPAPVAPTAKDVPAAHLKQVIAFARTLYNLTIADLGRGLTPANLSLLEQMDEIYLVSTFDIPALHQAKFVAQYLMEHGYAESRLRLVMNRRPRNMDLTVEEISSMLRVPVYATIPDVPQELQEASTQGHLVDAGTTLGRAYAELATKISGKTAPVKAKRLSFLGL